ncbi:MAG: Glycosyl transferase family 2 [Candidatus Woesebacteria bacterium GW2011_GWB1_39_10b]|uniref:Glycosyl transferase family 2 n=3 Tax=Candidatus Woeseibacteriota TaxID=1752722 RepID=A0A0G0M1A9_9BACT|nr:MAG: Glycosyl transferase family 2 [Candidatus Woesebacteria bacterium GW2011_GWB1_39_10b]OGM63693.1 MAG: hypothetical protein A3A52_02625 [Candidatus Woesebacteria bacterium RIFCSPLOWO2_01_FULL_39_14]
MTKMDKFTLQFTLSKSLIIKLQKFFDKNILSILILTLSLISVFAFLFYYENKLGLSYNDARSHLDMGRRVVENLKPGLAQLGSVWLPLPHILMIPTIWSDFMWHSGLSGAIQSMFSFVATGCLIYLFLKNLKIGLFERIFGVFIFVANINVLYLQSTAMTELLLLATMTAGVYFLARWVNDDNIFNLIKGALFVMSSTLIRYDGWFLFIFASLLVAFISIRKRGLREAEGNFIFYSTLAGFGIVMWLVWNLLIFKDPLYFAYGPYSAQSQQKMLEEAGELSTKGDFLMSAKAYFYSIFYNSYTFSAMLGFAGAVTFFLDKKIKFLVRVISFSLLAPLFFNIIALYLGHSVLFLPGIIGRTWFNIRYGALMLPSIAIFSAYLINKLGVLKWVFVGIFCLVIFFAFVNNDAATIEDAVYGESARNVSEVSTWLQNNAKDKEGLVLMSVASHDAIIFSSGLPMKKFIHEGTGAYWDYAIENPDRWATWIVTRTHDLNDAVFREVRDSDGFKKYELVDHYPFADIYQLKPEYRSEFLAKPVLGKQN